MVQTAKAIVAAYPGKRWSFSTVEEICKRVDKRGSAAERKAGSGRPRSSRTEENTAEFGEMICSQEGASRSDASIREITSAGRQSTALSKKTVLL